MSAAGGRPADEDPAAPADLAMGPVCPVPISEYPTVQMAHGGRIEVRVQSAGETSTCTVGDTGEGLAPEDLERIFERFYRVAGQRPGPGGSGIGLTIARGIVLAHGGTLTATSAGLGHGCVFTMTLPRSPR